MGEELSKLLVVQLNGIPVIEYDRTRELSPVQRESLHLMDEKLAQGITLHGRLIAQPALEQRVEFISANLIAALLNESDDNEALVASNCAYLANVLPDLQQVKAVEDDGQVRIELIFDRAWRQETKMNYVPLSRITKQ